ncbi:MAG: ankyrin repeat domain-containing protein [Bacteroidota bacterium]
MCQIQTTFKGQAAIAAERAIARNDADGLALILMKNPMVVHETNSWGSPLLHVAVRAYRLPLVEMLLDAGSDINFLNHRPGGTTTALHGAAQPYGSQSEWIEATDLVTLLIERGADPNLYAEQDPNSLAAPRTALQTSVSWSYEVSKLLVEAGADPNLMVGGRTALEVPLTTGHARMVRMLVCDGSARLDGVIRERSFNGPRKIKWYLNELSEFSKDDWRYGQAMETIMFVREALTDVAAACENQQRQ